MDKDYEFFHREYYNLPRHIKNKLRNMPNNKGYIINGIWYFGQLKNTSNKIDILFEKEYPYLYIHEITQRKHKITRMHINTKEKTLVSNSNRRHLPTLKNLVC